MTPTIALEKNTSKNVWLVKVYFPDTRTRVRPSLGIPLTEDPTAAFDLWKRDVLPHVLAEHLADTTTAATEETANPTIEHIAAWFLDTHCPYEGLAEKTIAHYTRILRDFTGYCRSRNVARVQQVSWRLIQDWQLYMVPRRRETNNTSVARRDELAALRHIFDQAADAQVLPERLNIAWKIPGKSHDSTFAALTLPETATFLSKLQTHAPAIYDPTLWMYLTGWLPSDALDLRINQINLPAQNIHRPRAKTGQPMDCPITPAHLEVIQRNLHGRPATDPAPLFLDPQRRPWDYSTYKKRLEYFCTKHHDRRQIRPRDLRKTFATQMARAGENPKILQRLLAHARVETTLDYYVDVDHTDLHDAATRHHQRYLQALQTTEKTPPKP